MHTDRSLRYMPMESFKGKEERQSISAKCCVKSIGTISQQMLLAARYKSLCVQNEVRDPLGELLQRKISNPLGLRNGITQL